MPIEFDENLPLFHFLGVVRMDRNDDSLMKRRDEDHIPVCVRIVRPFLELAPEQPVRQPYGSDQEKKEGGADPGSQVFLFRGGGGITHGTLLRERGSG